MIKAALTSYSRYNSGQGDFFTWLNFPATEEDIKTALVKIGNPEEIFFSDFDTPAGVNLPEHIQPDELNEIANILQGDGQTAFIALLNQIADYREALKIFKTERFSIIEAADDSELGYYCAENFFAIPENLVDYIDFEAIGFAHRVNTGGSYYNGLFIELH